VILLYLLFQLEMEVEWPPLGVPTEGERIDLAGKMAAAVKVLHDAGATQPLFDNNEIRRAGGYEDVAIAPEPVDPQGEPAPGDVVEPDNAE
jgi:hypothetical protein